jgi:iron complex transport system substrate-binding protein
MGIKTAYFSVENFDDYLSMLKALTDITGRSDLYEKNGMQIKEKIDEITAKTVWETSPTVLLLRASSGKVTARNSTTMAGKILKDMGLVNIADSDSRLTENLSMEIIIKEDPDFIFYTVMGDSEEKAVQSLQNTLTSNPAWASLTAVKNRNFQALPKNLFHQKPNAKWADAYQYIWENYYDGK